jgi:hypothetical protein
MFRFLFAVLVSASFCVMPATATTKPKRWPQPPDACVPGPLTPGAIRLDYFTLTGGHGGWNEFLPPAPYPMPKRIWCLVSDDDGHVGQCVGSYFRAKGRHRGPRSSTSCGFGLEYIDRTLSTTPTYYPRFSWDLQFVNQTTGNGAKNYNFELWATW